MGGAGGGRVVVRVWLAKINQNSVIEQAMTLDLYIFLAKYLIYFFKCIIIEQMSHIYT